MARICQNATQNPYPCALDYSGQEKEWKKGSFFELVRQNRSSNSEFSIIGTLTLQITDAV